MKNIFVYSILILAFLMASCHQQAKIKIIKNESKELIGMEFNKNIEIYLKDQCSPYVLYKKESETDSVLVYIFLAHGSCADAAYEITINKRTNKIIGIKEKNMA
jgi:hypothetical protein